MTFRIDLRWVVVGLIVGIIVIFGLWRPWEGINKRTIEVVGSAEIKATPDRFILTPIYQKKATTAKQALSDVSVIGNGVVAGLKELGVAQKSITTNVSNVIDYGSEPAVPERVISPNLDETTASYMITVEVDSIALAQKVLDYLITTPTASSPGLQASFSSDARKELENQARLQAAADGRKKAELMATSLGAELGRIIKVSEVQWGGPITPMEGRSTVSSDLTAPLVLPGEQTISFSLNLIYSLK